ncbi:Plant calmodulin-binding protein-like protein [Perilla frutescens var. hirtella]|nr:Plant calmodulin-binding protein-like protein [Perilla frutescens var. frutescens]KAH6792269.1 Plant calmodulin-binding protein-like protein [Perilla frutescens var. hirtella]
MQAPRTDNNQMATRRRDTFPGKEKTPSSPKTGTAKIRGAVNKISKTIVSTVPQKQTRPTAKTTATDVSKLQAKKPASPATAQKPAQARKGSLDNKTLNPTPKTRVTAVAAAPPRSSSLRGKTAASPKPAVGKSLKPVTKDEGKRRLSTSTTPVSNSRRSSIGTKKKETGTSASATKEQQITSLTTLEKLEDLSLYCVPVPEIQLKDIEYSYLAEAEEKTVQSLSDIEDVVTQDQEPLNFAKIQDEINRADSTVGIAESYPVSEQQDSPLDIKTQELENKYHVEDSSSKQELGHDTNNTNICNKVEKVAGNSHEEVGEEEVKEVEVAAEEQEAAVVSKADESKEIERPAVEKKQEISFPPKQTERTHGKLDSPVSNDVIEETASKLRELRKNKVRALAGAFETVISLQEK